MGRELTWFQSLLSDAGVVPLTEEVPDIWVWNQSPDSKFSVSSSYCFLQDPDLLAEDNVKDMVWHSFSPSNAKAFAWRCLLERIASGEILLKRGVLVSDQATCRLCPSRDVSTLNKVGAFAPYHFKKFLIQYVYIH